MIDVYACDDMIGVMCVMNFVLMIYVCVDSYLCILCDEIYVLVR